jgi:hypothetical protein
MSGHVTSQSVGNSFAWNCLTKRIRRFHMHRVRAHLLLYVVLRAQQEAALVPQALQLGPVVQPRLVIKRGALWRQVTGLRSLEGPAARHKVQSSGAKQ